MPTLTSPLAIARCSSVGDPIWRVMSSTCDASSCCRKARDPEVRASSTTAAWMCRTSKLML